MLTCAGYGTYRQFKADKISPKYGNVTQVELHEVTDDLRRECFIFTFIRDPVDRYISALYESRRNHPEEVNVTALTYAFVAANNADHSWSEIDHVQGSIFGVSQLEYVYLRRFTRAAVADIFLY